MIGWLAGIGVGIGALSVVVSLVYSLTYLLPGETVVNDRVAEFSVRSASRVPTASVDADLTPPVPDVGHGDMASPLPATAAGKRPKYDNSSPTAELDHEFRQFLADREHSMDELDQAFEPLPSREPIPETLSDSALELPQEATQLLKEEYPIQDARRKADGEVWLRLDPSEAQGLSMDELSAKAAELYGDGVDPLKVVVWVGNRPRAVNTFNGPPIF